MRDQARVPIALPTRACERQYCPNSELALQLMANDNGGETNRSGIRNSIGFDILRRNSPEKAQCCSPDPAKY